MTASLSPFIPFWGTERDIPNFCFYVDLYFFTLAKFSSTLSTPPSFPSANVASPNVNRERLLKPKTCFSPQIEKRAFSTRSRCLETHRRERPDKIRYVSSSAALRTATTRENLTGVFKALLSCAEWTERERARERTSAARAHLYQRQTIHH